MQAMLIRIFFFVFILVLIYPSSLITAQERRTALVIGNSTYSSGPLKNPVNDADDMAKALQRAGFTVTLKKNANLQEMVETIEDFGNSLKRGGVGLFYFAGHGVQVNSVNYLLPISARINKESDVRFQTVDAGRVLAEMENANNGLNVVILDACRDNPFGKSFRSASRGLAIVANAPTGTFISYSTGAGQVARDGEGRNSPYTRALLENMDKPGLSINNVFMKVRSKVKKETGQVPWELSSLEGDFFFMPGSASKSAVVIPDGKTTVARDESYGSATVATDELDEESRKLEDEERKLEKEKALLGKKKALEEKRKKIEEGKATLETEKRTTLSMAKRPSVPTANEIKRDGRFIAYDNGTVSDTRTNLMWAARDNGFDINWMEAKSYCENYRGGAYTDWRMPTLNELAGLYDTGKTYQSECRATFLGTYDIHLTELMRFTCAWAWTSETSGPNATLFSAYDGLRYSYPHSTAFRLRVLPVRSGK